MSHPGMLGLTTALYLAYVTSFLIADRWIHNRGEIVETGLRRGVPVTTELRRLMLYNSWLTLVSGVVASGLLMALAFVGIGRNADDPYVRVFAYLCAFQSGFVSAVWAGTGISWFRYYLRVLRQAEAD